MSYTKTINNYEDLVSAFKELKQEGFDEPHMLHYKEGNEKRKESMSRLYYHWLSQIANQSENSKQYERGYYKFTYGMNILQEDDDWFRVNVYDKMLEMYNYEEMIEICGTDHIQVTSTMSTEQMGIFLTEVREDAQRRGYTVTDLQDIYYLEVYNAKRSNKQN